MSIELVIPSNHLILCIPFSSCLQSFPASVSFSCESVFRIKWPKYWSFSFSISPSNEYPGLISIRMDWFDLLAVQGTLQSLLQHHRGKERTKGCSVLSVAFLCLLSHPASGRFCFHPIMSSFLQPPDLAWVIQRLQGSNPSDQEGGISNFLSSLHFSKRKQVLNQYVCTILSLKIYYSLLKWEEHFYVLI